MSILLMGRLHNRIPLERCAQGPCQEYAECLRAGKAAHLTPIQDASKSAQMQTSKTYEFFQHSFSDIAGPMFVGSFLGTSAMITLDWEGLL